MRSVLRIGRDSFAADKKNRRDRTCTQNQCSIHGEIYSLKIKNSTTPGLAEPVRCVRDGSTENKHSGVEHRGSGLLLTSGEDSPRRSDKPYARPVTRDGQPDAHAVNPGAMRRGHTRVANQHEGHGERPSTGREIARGRNRDSYKPVSRNRATWGHNHNRRHSSDYRSHDYRTRNSMTVLGRLRS